MIYDNHETLPSILLISYAWNDYIIYVARQTPLFYVFVDRTAHIYIAFLLS